MSLSRIASMRAGHSAERFPNSPQFLIATQRQTIDNPPVAFIPIIIVVLAIGFAISLVQRQSDHADIRRWAQQRGYQIDQIEKTWFDKGPFWIKGERRIYRCRVRDSDGRSRIVYMRTRFFENDYEFYDP